MNESTSTKAVITFDVETGNVDTVEKYVEGKKVEDVKGISIEELKLNGDNIIMVPDHTVILTHSSPGCFKYFYKGKYYKVCT